MTIHRYLNNAGWGSNYAIWYLIQAMKDAGWTVECSGSGTGGIYSATGDVFDPSDNPKKNTAAVNIGVGAGDEHFGNEGCWIVLADPDGNRQICFRRSKNVGDIYDAYWWVGLSESAGFVGGSPDVDDPPDASDERTISESGTKAAPPSLCVPGTAATMSFVAADDTPSPSGEYGFICIDFIATNAVGMSIGFDDIRDTAAGDTAPWVVWHNNNGFSASAMNGSSSDMFAIFDKGGAGETYEDVSYAPNYPSAYYCTKGRTSVYDSKERPLPYPIIGLNVGGFIGFSRWFRQAAVSRDYPNTGDGETLLYVDDVIIVDLLDGATTPLSI